MDWLTTSLTSPKVATVPVALLGAVVLLFGLTYLYTRIKFELDFRRFASVNTGDASLKPPRLPFAIPWVGSAPAFLSTKPHDFWTKLFSWYPRSLGACVITLGGNTTTVLFDVAATQYIMRDRKLGREEFNEQVAINGFGLSRAESDRYYEHHIHDATAERLPGHIESDKINLEYLLKTERVTEMTNKFMEVFLREIPARHTPNTSEVNLVGWLRSIMFHASTESLLGAKILEVIPELEPWFFQFDKDMLSMFFGLPKFMIRRQVSNREKVINAFMKWHEVVTKESSGQIVDPDAVAWEPLYGSRVNRARQIFYKRQGISRHSASGLDLGMMFGISSNAIPAAGWMLMHILASKLNAEKHEPSLFDLVMPEVEESRNPDGSVNITAVMGQPILLSVLHEVLRLYVDTLVSRQLPNDLTLPMSGLKINNRPESKSSERSLPCKAGSVIMVPTWPAHTNPETWQSSQQPPPSVFYPYRFLRPTSDEKDSKPVFSTAQFNGMFFPFGGGKTICPGRSFARQEILGAVATVLLEFDFEVLGYVDTKGRDTTAFPGLRDTFPGSAVMIPSGDLKVKMKRKGRA